MVHVLTLKMCSFFPYLMMLHFSCLLVWEGSHAYNKGKALVFSKVPLPDYRADLDERHGSTQKEVLHNY